MTHGIAWLPIETSHLVSDLTSLKGTEVEKANTRQKNGMSKKCSFRLVCLIWKWPWRLLTAVSKVNKICLLLWEALCLGLFDAYSPPLNQVWYHVLNLALRRLPNKTNKKKKEKEQRTRYKSRKPVFLVDSRKIDRLWFLRFSVLMLHVLPWTTKNLACKQQNPLKFHNPLPNR